MQLDGKDNKKLVVLRHEITNKGLEPISADYWEQQIQVKQVDKVPSMIKQAQVTFRKNIVTNKIVTEISEYSISVLEEQVQVRGYYPFTRDGEIAVFTYIDLTYTYDSENKIVRLKSQAFSMSNYGEEAIYPKDNFGELLTSISQIIELPKDEIERSLTNFENDYGKVDQRPVAEKITLYSNDEEMKEKKEVSQSMRVGFNDKREMREVYTALVDYTE